MEGARENCDRCNGSGRVENPIIRAFAGLSEQRLRFEYEKRQREVDRLRDDLRDARRQLDELYDWWENVQRTSPPGRWNAPGSEPGGLHSIPRQMDQQEAAMRELKDEIDIIDALLAKKLR